MLGVLTGCLPRPALSLLALHLTPSGEFTWGQRLDGCMGGLKLPYTQAGAGNAGYPTYSPCSLPAPQNSHMHSGP